MSLPRQVSSLKTSPTFACCDMVTQEPRGQYKAKAPEKFKLPLLGIKSVLTLMVCPEDWVGDPCTSVEGTAREIHINSEKWATDNYHVSLKYIFNLPNESEHMKRDTTCTALITWITKGLERVYIPELQYQAKFHTNHYSWLQMFIACFYLNCRKVFHKRQFAQNNNMADAFMKKGFYG